MAPTVNPIDVSIKIPGCKKLIQLSTIIRFQGFGNYTWLYQHAHRPVLIAKSLNWFEQMLPGFVRVRKSDLINPLFVQCYQRHDAKALDVTLPNEHTIRVSRRRVDPVLLKLKHHEPQLN